MSNVTVIDAKTEVGAAPIPPVLSESAAIIQMVERASRDPSVDLDKMERLIRMRKEMLSEEAERAFNKAMKATQAEMRPISANATNSQTKSHYATYDQLDRALRPIYTAHGFSLSFDEGDTPKTDQIRVLCYVSHDDGHTRVYRKDMPADGKGAKGGDVMTKTHAAGAAASYGARYLLKGIFNVAVGEDDRDGNDDHRSEAPPISREQMAELQDLIDQANLPIEKFCRSFKVASMAEVTTADLPKIVTRIYERIAKLAAAKQKVEDE